MGKAKIHNLPPNPFTGRNPDEVWKELLSKSTPITKDEAARKMKEASEKQLKNKSKNE